MCSFIFTNKSVNNQNLDSINFYTKFRGPDNTNIHRKNGYTFIHNLLSITGKFTLQPFIEDDIICLYNGEIYNYKEFGQFSSDGECLIPLYKKYGPKFVQHLDGEFAITLIDLNTNTLIISTDTFKTKPIFYSLDGGIGVSSYSMPLKTLGHTNVQSMTPNTALVIDLNTKNIKETFNIHQFDLSQHKSNYNDWIKAFERSIKKRTQNTREQIFIGLSGGYDSGAICCELLNQNTPFKSYTVIGTENETTLKQRFNKLKTNPFQTLTKSSHEILIAHNHIEDNTEPFKFVTYSNSSDYNEYWLSLIDDNGANHLSHVCKHAVADKRKILLSGQGADEIFSDYGFKGEKKYEHSNFGGLFPYDLSTIFPWPSFFNSSMESYLAKEEYVAGSYGIETRYPFLDLDVIQEFLWLDSNIKNSHYKSVLHQYLTQNNFPFIENEKIGF